MSSELANSDGHHSRPLSWLWVTLISAGFVVGTVGVCLASWTISIIGAVLALAFAIAALAAGIMDDVDEQTSRDLWPIGPRDDSYKRRRSA